jgi:dTDP-4-dehydrorhamnose 3,5-epimerase-like enzyme
MYTNWQAFKDPDGTLVPIEFDKLPFVPKRMFYVCDIPKDEERGNHAHYETKQVLICVQGEILVKLHNGKTLETTILKPNQSVFVDKMVWDSQVFLTGNDVLMSICSTPYDKADYIEDFDSFLRSLDATFTLRENEG